MKTEDKTPIVRRQIVDEVSNGNFSMMLLMHMAHYDASAKLYVEASDFHGRPIDVVNIGAGDLWDLRVFIHGMKMRKADILRSYHAVDIISRKSPFGKSLSEEIEFTYTSQDLMENRDLPIESESADVVICTEFIEHIDRRSAISILWEIRRILRYEGMLYLTTPNAYNTTRTDKYHIYEWGLEELKGALEEIGFVIYSCYGTAIDMREFRAVNAMEGKFPNSLVEDIEDRFTPNFCRLFLSTPYPERATHVAIYAGLS